MKREPEQKQGSSISCWHYCERISLPSKHFCTLCLRVLQTDPFIQEFNRGKQNRGVAISGSWSETAAEHSRMLEGRALVEDTDMPLKMQVHAVSSASQALDLYDVFDYKSIAAHIKKVAALWKSPFLSFRVTMDSSLLRQWRKPFFRVKWLFVYESFRKSSISFSDFSLTSGFCWRFSGRNLTRYTVVHGNALWVQISDVSSLTQRVLSSTSHSRPSSFSSLKGLFLSLSPPPLHLFLSPKSQLVKFVVVIKLGQHKDNWVRKIKHLSLLFISLLFWCRYRKSRRKTKDKFDGGGGREAWVIFGFSCVNTINGWK